MFFRGFSDCNKVTLCLLSSNAEPHCEKIHLLPHLLLWFVSIYGCGLVCYNFDPFSMSSGDFYILFNLPRSFSSFEKPVWYHIQSITWDQFHSIRKYDLSDNVFRTELLLGKINEQMQMHHGKSQMEIINQNPGPKQ